MSETKHCPFVARCPMFPEFTSEASLGIFKIHYCHGAYETCERYKRASAGTPPLPRMLPDGTMMREVPQREPR